MPDHGSLQLRSAVHNAYSAAAERPTQKHAFPVGRLLAERLGDPADLLDTLPPVSVAIVTSVSCELMFAFNWVCIAPPL